MQLKLGQLCSSIVEAFPSRTNTQASLPLTTRWVYEMCESKNLQDSYDRRNFNFPTVLHYSIDFIFLFFGIMGFIVELWNY